MGGARSKDLIEELVEVSRPRRGANGGNQQKRREAQPPHQRTHGEQRRAVHPVQVLDNQHHGRLAARLLHQVGDLLDDAVTKILLGPVLGCRSNGVARQQVRDGGATGIGRTPAEVERVHQPTEGARALEGVALSPQDGKAGGPSLFGRPLHETCLADARLALD
jgi:hypothetical protein